MDPDPRLQRTQHAARAATLADQFRRAVVSYPVGPYQGDMTAPEESTAGGVQALQHVRLVPVNGRGRTYVVGNANRSERVAELRSLEFVDRVSRERFGHPSGLDPAAYATFIGGAAEFLEMFGLHVTFADAQTLARATGAWHTPSRGGFIAWSCVVLLTGFALGVLAMRLGWVR